MTVEEEDALTAIDNQAFNTKVAYTNVNEPSAPTDVTLQTSGNEVMRAEWNASDNVDGYSVRIYEEKDGEWTDTGFGYDLDKDTTAVDMALTVGGNGVSVNRKRRYCGVCSCRRICCLIRHIKSVFVHTKNRRTESITVRKPNPQANFFLNIRLWI